MLRSICGPSRSRRHIWCWRPPSSWWGLGGGGASMVPVQCTLAAHACAWGHRDSHTVDAWVPPGHGGHWVPGCLGLPCPQVPPAMPGGAGQGWGLCAAASSRVPHRMAVLPPLWQRPSMGEGHSCAHPPLPQPRGDPGEWGGGGILRPSPSPPPPVLGSPHGRGSPGPGTPRAPGDLWGASKPGSFVPPPSVLQAVAVPAPPAAKG